MLLVSGMVWCHVIVVRPPGLKENDAHFISQNAFCTYKTGTIYVSTDWVSNYIDRLPFVHFALRTGGGLGLFVCFFNPLS